MTRVGLNSSRAAPVVKRGADFQEDDRECCLLAGPSRELRVLVTEKFQFDCQYNNGHDEKQVHQEQACSQRVERIEESLLDHLSAQWDEQDKHEENENAEPCRDE